MLTQPREKFFPCFLISLFNIQTVCVSAQGKAVKHNAGHKGVTLKKEGKGESGG